ncbi:histidinol dehydrogenase [Candidatus Fermentibacteria bacterium]|nr:histidinol dehydrogenase [Candidatus Fermentibacteria bacterium]
MEENCLGAGRQKMSGWDSSIHRGGEAMDLARGWSLEASVPSQQVVDKVEEIIDAVRKGGDTALTELARKYGDPPYELLSMDDPEVLDRIDQAPTRHARVIQNSAARITRFAEAVASSLRTIEVEYDDYTAYLEYRPVAAAGCYVPAGRYALPSSVLMTALQAKAAGVGRIVVCSPSPKGEILLACLLAGVESLAVLGGAQAVAAMALGTESLPKVDVIAGPGNIWVTEAKRQLQGWVGIDMLAGPSEVAVLADGSADPGTIALDLLAQAEHDPSSRSWLLTDNEDLARAVSGELDGAIKALGYSEGTPGEDQIIMLVLENLSECAEAANILAPEHLELIVRAPEEVRPLLESYGALFVGPGTCVGLGDYLAGPSHVLPTGGTASFTGGLSPLHFLRTQCRVAAHGHRCSAASDAADFARMEGLRAHERSIRQRS